MAAEVVVVGGPPLEPPSVAHLLLPGDHDRMAVLRRPVDRARFATGRALLRVLVAHEVGIPSRDVAVDACCPTCGGPHGRPRVGLPAGLDAMQASISHAGDWVLVALARVAVGVDVEPTGRTRFDGFDTTALSAAERSELEGVPPELRAAARAQAWVRKEALLKLCGAGLTIEPSGVEVGVSADDRLVVDPLDADRPVALLDLPLDPAHRAAVAVYGTRMPPVTFVPAAQLLAATEAALPRSTG